MLKNKRSIVIVTLLLTILASCTKRDPLSQIKETPLYQEVITHYTDVAPSDEKKEAALFLFEYMGYKYSQYEPKVDTKLSSLADSLQSLDKRLKKWQIIKLIKDSIPQERSATTQLRDVDTLTSAALIDHINTTYTNWQKLSSVSSASFNDYCAYILPYRVSNEPVFELATDLFSQEFSWFQDSLLVSDSIIETIHFFINKVDLKMEIALKSRFRYPYSVLQAYHIGLLPRCDDVAITLASMLRSIGLPATTDYVNQWGNHHYAGHRWITVKWKGKWYAFDPTSGEYLSKTYHEECIVKAYRSTYVLNDENQKPYIDVTNKYVTTNNLTVELKGLPHRSPPSIAIFNKFSEFKTMAYGERKKDSVTFRNMGNEVLYFCGYEKDGVFVPLSHPIYLDSLGKARSLIANNNKLETYTLWRKYPRRSIVRQPDKINWGSSLCNSIIVASNDDYLTQDTLLILSNYNSAKEERFDVKTSKPYKSIKYICVKRNKLAEFTVWDANHDTIKGELFGNYGLRKNMDYICDGNILTWKPIGGRKKPLKYVGFHFDSPQVINSISLLARNDGNQVVIGNQYELMLWVDGWKSYGIQTATDQKLIYEEVPSGGLYWLKNLTTGQEELPFIMTEEGKQYWIGS